MVFPSFWDTIFSVGIVIANHRTTMEYDGSAVFVTAKTCVYLQFVNCLLTNSYGIIILITNTVLILERVKE